MPTPKFRPFRESDWFAVGDAGERYPKKMPGMIDGVYAIRNATSRVVLYVGESHTGRLRDTLSRHLRGWNEQGVPREHYYRTEVEVAWRATSKPLDYEAWLIRHYRPVDNMKGMFDELEPPTPRPTKEADQAAPVAIGFNPFEF